MKPALLTSARFFVVLTLSILPSLAQTMGEVTGRITDPSGAAVPSADVVVTNSATNVSRKTVSNDSGDYTFPSLPPGVYKVRIEHQGFKATETSDVQVQVQQTVRMDFTMQVGQLTQSVLVEASAAQLQAENATVGTVIDNKRIVELPLNGRNYLQLVSLTPNATTLSPSAGQAGSRQGGDRASQSISVAGQRTMFDYFTLDGTDNTDPTLILTWFCHRSTPCRSSRSKPGFIQFGHNAT